MSCEPSEGCRRELPTIYLHFWPWSTEVERAQSEPDRATPNLELVFQGAQVSWVDQQASRDPKDDAVGQELEQVWIDEVVRGQSLVLAVCDAGWPLAGTQHDVRDRPHPAVFVQVHGILGSNASIDGTLLPQYLRYKPFEHGVHVNKEPW